MFATATLVAHRGAQLVSRDALATVEGSDIHVMLTLRCSSRQVVVADEQLNGTDMIDEFLGERQRVTYQT